MSATLRDDVRCTIVTSVENLVPRLPNGADGYFLDIGGRHGKYIRARRDVADEIVAQAGCLDSCEITGLGVWEGGAWREWDASDGDPEISEMVTTWLGSTGARVDVDEIAAADEITRLRAENEELRDVVQEHESDPDYARSRFREIDLLKDQRAHDRLKIRGLRERAEELEEALEEIHRNLDPEGFGVRFRTAEDAVSQAWDAARRALRGETK